MYTAQYTPTEVRRQAPAPWSIYAALSADELIALRAAGVHIVGRYVMSRICPQCGQPGEVGVTETTLADGIAFIARDGWTCQACRERETAHLVPSPRPLSASRAPSAAGNGGRGRRGKRNPSRRQLTHREREINKWQRQLDGAQATLDLIAAGLMSSRLRDSMHSLVAEARHHLTRLGIVVLEVA